MVCVHIYLKALQNKAKFFFVRQMTFLREVYLVLMVLLSPALLLVFWSNMCHYNITRKIKTVIVPAVKSSQKVKSWEVVCASLLLFIHILFFFLNTSSHTSSASHKWFEIFWFCGQGRCHSAVNSSCSEPAYVCKWNHRTRRRSKETETTVNPCLSLASLVLRVPWCRLQPWQTN